MKRFITIYLLAILFGLAACQEAKKITDPKDYDRYLLSNPQRTAAIRARIDLWNRHIQKDSMQVVEIRNIANEYTQLFEATAEIVYLKRAEQALLKVLDFGGLRKDRLLLDLARNYISQHRFREASELAKEAHQIYPNRAAKLVLFDASMELGRYGSAETFLYDSAVHQEDDFDYLIRSAKWNDHLGNMGATLRDMEKACALAQKSNDKFLMQWSYTNLATYYGHAGSIGKSYDFFLKALDIDPNNAFAKKGIAWIAYSHEQNAKEASRIMNAVTLTHSAPDNYLFLAELAQHERNEESRLSYLRNYEKGVRDKRYGNMYNMHNALLLSEEHHDFEAALDLSEEEVLGRPTAQAYSLKAHILNLSGKHQQALAIVEKYVTDKTFEPKAIYYAAEVYKSNGHKDKVTMLKKELSESSYELGPIINQKIMEL